MVTFLREENFPLPLSSLNCCSIHCITPAMQYGHNNEPVAHGAYIAKQRDEYDRTTFVSKVGLHIDFLV